MPNTSGGGSPLLLLMLAMPVVLWLMMRSQKKKAAAQQAQQRSAGVGDDIMTTAGIFGTIVDEDEDEGTVIVEIAPGTQIKMIRAGIARRVEEDDEYEDVDETTRTSRRAPTRRGRRQRRGPVPLVSDDAIGTPSGAPVPEVPPVEPATEVASVTLADVQADPELSLYIASADRVMDAMGYTEHGFRHAHLVGKIAYQVLHRLGFSRARGGARARRRATCTTWATRCRARGTRRPARCSRTTCCATGPTAPT